MSDDYPVTIQNYTVYGMAQTWYDGQRCYRITASGGSIGDYFTDEATFLHTEEHNDQWTVHVIPDKQFIAYAAALDRLGAWGQKP